MTEQEINKKTEDLVDLIHGAEKAIDEATRQTIKNLQKAVDNMEAPREVLRIAEAIARAVKFYAQEIADASDQIDQLNEEAADLYDNRE